VNTKLVTIASVRAHRVRQLLVYCRGKRGDWPCHHEATLHVDRFEAARLSEKLSAWSKVYVRPNYSKPLPSRTSVGSMLLPSTCGMAFIAEVCPV
jgi:hypothetical protein